MVVVCPVCREVVRESGGYIVVHGFKNHGVLVQCAGSGQSYPLLDSCCS